MKKSLVLCNFITVVSALTFSLMQISFSLDLSLVALPLSLLFVIVLSYVTYWKFYKGAASVGEIDVQKLGLLSKLLQYVPYVLLAAFVFRRAGENGTTHWYDVLTVFLWLITAVSSRVVLFFLKPKRFFKQYPELKEKLQAEKKSVTKKVIYEAFDWIDAFVQAICTVALFNIFIFQLYEIPSESMVSEFLVRDRVVGWKLDAGPKFPLSDVGVPEIKNYERGDIVIFSNPHYSTERESQVKSFLSQLVYMLTLTTVNLNVDEDGNLKADPLVKRIVGVEGEQLVMQDGVLYRSTKNDAGFTVVKDDALWAVWNLAGLPNDTLSKVQSVPLSQTEYDIMLEIEAERRGLSLTDARSEVLVLSDTFSRLKNSLSLKTAASVEVDSFKNNNDLHVYRFLTQSDDLIRTIFYSNGGSAWFTSFMTDWIQEIPNDVFENGGFIGGNIYSNAMFKQNLMIKLYFGRLAVRTAELLVKGVGASSQNMDIMKKTYMQEIQNLVYYMVSINDMRNMEVFPPMDKDGNAQYIQKNNFFVMGDNRFNSLDMRHSYDFTEKKITDYDSWSLYYDSNLEPRVISTDSILGSPVVRFYPFNRFSIIKNGVEKSN